MTLAAALKAAKYAGTEVRLVHTDACVSMGEPKAVWRERVRLLAPYQVNAAAMEDTGNPRAKFMHCLPAFYDTKRDSVVAEDPQEHHVPDEVQDAAVHEHRREDARDAADVARAGLARSADVARHERVVTDRPVAGGARGQLPPAVLHEE